jgi:hypothetical protein
LTIWVKFGPFKYDTHCFKLNSEKERRGREEGEGEEGEGEEGEENGLESYNRN